MYLCWDYMAYTNERRLISIFGHSNLSFPLLEHITEDAPHHSSTWWIQPTHTLMFQYSTYILAKFCSYNPSSNFYRYLWNWILLLCFGQSLCNHHQGHHHPARLWKPCMKYHSIVVTLSQPYKVAITYIEISIW